MVNLGRNKVLDETSLLLLLFHLNLFFVRQVNSYDPPDNIAVNCGHKGNDIFQNRSWTGDVDTQAKLFSLIEPKTGQKSVEAGVLQSPSIDRVPFGSARFSHSNFTYSFHVTNGPKFLRLHFYPTSYANFTTNNSFSVYADNFTLLEDFNASLWVVNEDDEKVSIEFCISVETAGKGLSVTFIPSTNHSDAYAFINGIEVVSMPPFLYYTDPNDISDPAKFKLVGVGQDNAYGISNDKALQTLYRVDCGEGQVSPGEDTGMFRTWENDAPYMMNPYPESAPKAGWGLHLNYKNNTVPNYTAPEVVYLTARNYGEDGSFASYALIWEFEVDSEFIYMVRLHFCEFEYEITGHVNRTFQIFIADILAEEYADVIKWSGGRLIPTHRDYAVDMHTNIGTSQKLNLTVMLQRHTNHDYVILNGIEIFKISDENNNLGGPNPERKAILSPPQLQNQSSKSIKTTSIIIAAVAVSGLVLASVVGFIVFRRRRRAHDMEGNSCKKTEGLSLPSYMCRYFTIAEIRAATNNFDDAFIVGEGGFGSVYKGYIGGATPVAIKRLKQGSQQGDPEFKNEIVMLSKLRHPHLVPLIGYCNDGAEMILVYGFMQRGTLREHLYGSDNQPLPWKQRLQILLDAAKGLHYLHAGAKQSIIHRDVKSPNILLDENWVAKVSDFGLSKVGPSGVSRTHVTTMVKGSIGYLDPEYYKSQRLTLKSDVYSFGVVLLEVLCARPPLIRTLLRDEASLVDWVRRCYDEGEIHLTVDPFLKDSITAECLKCYCEMALTCLHDDANQRPSMTDVIEALMFALQLVDSHQDEPQV